MIYKNIFKFFTILSLFLSVSASAFIRSNSIIYRTPGGGAVIIPRSNSESNTQKNLQGAGMVFNGSVKVSTETEEDPVTKLPKEKKIYKVWIRNCGDVTIPTTKDDESKIKNGDRVELRFDGTRSCNVASWQRFYQ
jgi:hypothetical protein